MSSEISRREALLGMCAVLTAGVGLAGDQAVEESARLLPEAEKLRFSSNPVEQGAASTWVNNDLIVTSRICPPSATWGSKVPGTIVVRRAGTEEIVAQTDVVGEESNDFRVRVVFPNLDPGCAYTYEVSASYLSADVFVGHSKPPSLLREANILLGGKRYVRVAVISCMSYSGGYWDALKFALKVRGTHAAILAGDAIYIDGDRTPADSNKPRLDPTPSAKSLHEILMKHLACNDADRRMMLGEIPVFSIPDDHDLGVNNYSGSGSVVAKNISDAFTAYTLVYPSANGAETNGFFRRIDFGGGVRALLLDTRMFRDYKKDTMLGEKQLNWLLNELSNAKSDNVNRLFLVSSVSFGSGLDSLTDSWAAVTRERQPILDRISKLALRNVTFISGDLHTFYTSPIYENPLNDRTDIIGYELECGAVSSLVGRTQEVNPRLFAYTKNSHGYMELNVDLDTGRTTAIWFLYNAKVRGYTPIPGAIFEIEPQGLYSAPNMGYVDINRRLVSASSSLPPIAR